jgi:hypothetical protein
MRDTEVPHFWQSAEGCLGPVSMVLAESSHELQLQLDIIHIENKLMHLNVSYSITCEADPNVELGA